MDALFHDRSDAGKKLASELLKYAGEEIVVLAIPRGGVPVGYEIAEELNAEELDVIICRKIPIPMNPEAGFGAVTSTWDSVLNPEVLKQIHLAPEEIIELSEEVYKEVKRRTSEYRGSRPFPILRDKTVIIVDDGIATGFTMVAAIKSVRKYAPGRVVVAVPAAPKQACDKIREYADDLVTLWCEETESFAVASFYEEFEDLSDAQVVQTLEGFRERE